MEWISVKTKLPELYVDVILCCEDKLGLTYKEGEKYLSFDRLCKWNDTGDISFRAEKFGYGKPICWIPSPELPKD
jgi:hypothetical protein